MGKESPRWSRKTNSYYCIEIAAHPKKKKKKQIKMLIQDDDLAYLDMTMNSDIEQLIINTTI